MDEWTKKLVDTLSEIDSMHFAGKDKLCDCCQQVFPCKTKWLLVDLLFEPEG